MLSLLAYSKNFDKNQMEQLMAMLVRQFSASDNKDDQQDNANNHPASGNCFSISIPNVFNSSSPLDRWFLSV